MRLQSHIRRLASLCEYHFLYGPGVHPVLDGMAREYDFIARFQSTPTPTPPGEKIGALRFSGPFLDLIIFISHGELYEYMGVEVLERRDGSMERNRFGVVVFRGTVMGES